MCGSWTPTCTKQRTGSVWSVFKAEADQYLITVDFPAPQEQRVNFRVILRDGEPVPKKGCAFTVLYNPDKQEWYDTRMLFYNRILRSPVSLEQWGS